MKQADEQAQHESPGAGPEDDSAASADQLPGVTEGPESETAAESVEALSPGLVQAETVAEPSLSDGGLAALADEAESGLGGSEAPTDFDPNQLVASELVEAAMGGSADANPEAAPAGDGESDELRAASEAAADDHMAEAGADEFASASQQDQPLVETISVAEARAGVSSAIDAMGGEDDHIPDTIDMPPSELRGVLESMLLVSAKPLTTVRLVKLLPGADAAYLEGFLRGLADRFDHEQRGWALRQVAGGWQLLTRPAYHAWVRQLDRKELPTALSRSAMETLAIVAYKQPVTRVAIEDIRGVQSGPMLRQLMDLKMVQVIGRDDSALGHPLLYGTTDQFLDRFNLGSPDDLPRHHELGA